MNLSREEEEPLPPQQCQRTNSISSSHSRTIQFPSSHVTRTQSELQLSEDMAAAEWKDLCMFYRVVGGIRKQQEQHLSSTVGGVPIHQEQHKPRHNPVRDWTGKDVSATTDTAARVTPFDSSEGSSPQDRKMTPYPQSLLLKSPRRSNDGGWSITGFDDDPQDTSRLALIEQDEDMCEEEVFVMDL